MKQVVKNLLSVRRSSPSPHRPGRTAGPSSLPPCPLPPRPPHRCCTPPWSRHWRNGWCDGASSPSPSAALLFPAPPAPHSQSRWPGLDSDSGERKQANTLRRSEAFTQQAANQGRSYRSKQSAVRLVFPSWTQHLQCNIFTKQSNITHMTGDSKLQFHHHQRPVIIPLTAVINKGK